MATTKSKGGCGCGGGSGGSGGGSSGGGCGCGGGCNCNPARLPPSAPAICSPCETASFVRPRFFAGQLLTEDDLGSLVDYVVAKNRFHNSRLFGEGVVCGLEVECGPCDGTQIVVKPGYALDCCGNDLVLTCEQTLDVAPMIRALAAQLHTDCTDPCAASDTSTKESSAQTKQFCLYAKYAERLDQPVAAYPVADDCDAASCEPTRVVEGIVFELRCPSQCKPLTIHDLVKQSAEQIDAQGVLSAAALTLKSVAVALPTHEQLGANAFTQHEIVALREGGARDIEALVAQARGDERWLAYARYLPAVHGLYLRQQLKKIDLPSGVDTEKIVANAAAAAHALEQMTSADFEKLAPTDAALIKASLATYQQLSKKDYKSPESQAYIAGGVGSQALVDATDEVASALASRLKEVIALGKNLVQTDCTVIDAVGALQPTSGAKVKAAVDYAMQRQRLDALVATVGGLTSGILCAWLNPPCPPCDDLGVLLACFEVEGCKVVKICNAARCNVLAPTALRYWGFHDTQKAFESCCLGKATKPNTGNGIDLAQGLRVDPARDAFVEVPQTRSNLLALQAFDDAANLHERLVPKLAIPDERLAYQAEIVTLRRQLAAVTRRLDELENRSHPVDKAEKVEKTEKPERKGK